MSADPGETSGGRALRYMAQLDGLRCVAVAAVLVIHFARFELPRFAAAFPWGAAGVQLFFVLSGFLITGILLRCRDADRAAGRRPWQSLKSFYARRVLRIFPLYYGVLIVAALANVDPVREGLAWHFTYTTNVYLALEGNWSYTITHFWTLAVEEQFYLLWPWFILMARRRSLVPVTLAVIGLAPAVRLGLMLAGAGEVAVFVLLPANMDTLGLGALLAILTRGPGAQPRYARRLSQLGLWVGLPVAATLVILRRVFELDSPYEAAALHTFLGLFYVWVIDRAAVGFRGVTGWVLGSRPMVYVGKISYGVYVHHLFALVVVEEAVRGLALSYPFTGARMLSWTALTLLMAATTWHLFEQPISRLKTRLPYATGPRAPAGRTATTSSDEG